MRRLRKHPLTGQLFRFGLSSGISAAITVGLPALLHEAGHVAEQRAVLTAFAAAFVVNFLAMRHFVFAARGSATGDVIRYLLASVAFRTAEYGAFSVLFAGLHLHYLAAVVMVLAVSAGMKFCIYRFVVFDGRIA